MNSDRDAIFEGARALQKSGDAAAAEAGYIGLLARWPEDARALTNLGVLLEERGETSEALARYRAACKAAPDLALPHANAGRLLAARGELAAAEEALRTAMRLDPAYPGHPSALGDLLFDQRRLVEALAAYLRVADLAPEEAVAHHDLGKTLELLGQHEGALGCYQRALTLGPPADATREGVVRMLTGLDRGAEAVTFLEAWAASEPGRGYAEQLLAALGRGPIPDRAADGYVRALFDRFADRFDATLATLDYRAPAEIAAALHQHVGPGSRALDILDAGCGTGLCAPLLAPMARRLEGVDLSSRMLHHARQRGGYDALHEGELVGFLAGQHERFDVVVSADTFCYLGPLEPACRAAASALRPGGWLVFTLERGQGDGVELGESGRYRHGEAQVREALLGAGMTIVSLETITPRSEGGEPVVGWRVVARRGAGPLASSAQP